MKLSIILPNYCPDQDVEKYLNNFLNTLERTMKKEDYQFVVIENGSQSERLKSLADIYIYKEKPIGYARAVNIGLALADGDYLLIANNDLELPDGWFEKMIEDYQGGILSPMDQEWKNPEPRIYEDQHWFSLVLMDRPTFIKVGYLDQSINYRFHDQDYSIRVKKAGFPVRRTGKVVVKHINMATFSRMGRPGDEEEKREMIKKYGCSLFDEYVKCKK